MNEDVKTLRIDVNINALIDAGVLQYGPNYPKDVTKECNFWIGVYVQEDPDSPVNVLGIASAYLSGGELDEPVDLGINPDTAFGEVVMCYPMPWSLPYYGGPW